MYAWVVQTVVLIVSAVAAAIALHRHLPVRMVVLTYTALATAASAELALLWGLQLWLLEWGAILLTVSNMYAILVGDSWQRSIMDNLAAKSPRVRAALAKREAERSRRDQHTSR